MKLRIMALAGLFAAGGVGAAQARLEPTPPPSGIVIHLFGPDSVMQNVAPALAGAPVRAQAGAATAAAAPGAAPDAETPDADTPAAEPGWGPVLHEMFVTGDPNAPNQPARGKTGHQLED